MQQEGEEGEDGADPHEGKHLDANDGANVELVLGGEGNLGGDADDGGDDGGDDEGDDGEEADDGEEEGEKAAADGERGEKDHDKVDDGAGHEAAVHDLGADAEEGEDGDDLRGEGDAGAGEELRDEDLDGVEPVELLGLGAVRDASGEGLAIVSSGVSLRIVRRTRSKRAKQLKEDAGGRTHLCSPHKSSTGRPSKSRAGQGCGRPS